MRKLIWLLAGIMALTMVGCGSSSSDDVASNDDVDVTAYKGALPSATELLTVKVPEAPAGRTGLAIVEPPPSTPAEFPALAGDPAEGVNGFVTAILTTLNAVTDLPYSYYDADDKVVFWGPFKDEATAGEFVLTVSLIPAAETGEEDGDIYAYSLYRVEDDFDLLAAIAADVEPEGVYAILEGFSSPDNVDGPIGVLRFDFDANATAEDAFGGDSSLMPEGVFAAVYGKNFETDITNTFVLSVVRNFAEPAGGDTADLDYFYGNHLNSSDAEPLSVDYFNFLTEADVIPDTPDTEILEVQLAFINQSFGRAEVNATGGDAGEEGIEIGECWDTQLNQSWLAINGTDVVATSAACQEPFTQDFTTLGMPAVSDLGYLYTELEAFAINGFPE